MCFSATASFTAGTALSAVGGLTITRSRGKTELPLALVPLLFGIQQISEGFLWLSINNSLAGLQTWTTYIFSMFSHVLWPIFVPFAIVLVEPSERRRRALRVFLAMGAGVGLYLLYFILRYPVAARVEGRSIFYDSPHFFIMGALVIYLLATCVSGLFSSHRCVNTFGVLAFVLAIAAYQVSVKTFVSVWCFFAAVLSLFIVIHFYGPMQRCRPALDREREKATPDARWTRRGSPARH
jgi:hypothetical protein